MKKMFFDLTDVSEMELAQFPNLKKAVIINSECDKIFKKFIHTGIKVEEL